MTVTFWSATLSEAFLTIWLGIGGKMCRRRVKIVIATILVSVAGCGYLPESVRIRKPKPAAVGLHQGTWILIDSRRDTLTVMQDQSAIKIFDNVAFGSSGVGNKQLRGDNVTPRGTFSIGWSNGASKYYRFWGLTYPSIDDANEGLRRGYISRSQHEAIIRAHQLGITPPQNTALGGQIGIHGTGRGSVDIHRVANWTNGCIALENHQVDILAQWIRPGMVVEIR